MAKSEGRLPTLMTSRLIAPCGMNCALCSGYLRAKKQCPGCRAADDGKPSYCVHCQISTCERLAKGELAFCGSDCDAFPCKRLKQLDKRYRAKYGMSMLDNLETIREIGVDKFVAKEKTRWTCPECGSLLCVHKTGCLTCGYVWNSGSGDLWEGNHAC